MSFTTAAVSVVKSRDSWWDLDGSPYGERGGYERNGHAASGLNFSDQDLIKTTRRRTTMRVRETSRIECRWVWANARGFPEVITWDFYYSKRAGISMVNGRER